MDIGLHLYSCLIKHGCVTQLVFDDKLGSNIKFGKKRDQRLCWHWGIFACIKNLFLHATRTFLLPNLYCKFKEQMQLNESPNSIHQLCWHFQFLLSCSIIPHKIPPPSTFTSVLTITQLSTENDQHYLVLRHIFRISWLLRSMPRLWPWPNHMFLLLQPESANH